MNIKKALNKLGNIEEEIVIDLSPMATLQAMLHQTLYRDKGKKEYRKAS